MKIPKFDVYSPLLVISNVKSRSHTKQQFFTQSVCLLQGEEQMGDLGLEEENLAEHMSVDSRPVSQLGTARAPVIVNPVLAELLEQDKKNPDPIDVSEVTN